MAISLRLAFLGFLVCVASLPVSSGHARRQANSTQMEFINGPELMHILARIAMPFSNLKDQRNLQLDQILEGTLENFAPVGPDLLELYQIVAEFMSQLPRYRSQFLPGVMAAFSQLSVSAEQLQDLFERCPSALSVLPGATDSADDSISASLPGWISAMLSGSLSSLQAGAEAEKQGQQVAKLGDMVSEMVNQVANIAVDEDVVQELGKSLACDAQCRAIATGASNLGKHVKIEDVTAAFTTTLATAMERHRARYLALIPKVAGASKSVAQASALVNTVLQYAKTIKTTSDALTKETTTAVQSYLKGGKLLQAALGRLRC